MGKDREYDRRLTDAQLDEYRKNPDGFLDELTRQARMSPRRDHRDDGCLFFMVAPAVLVVTLLRRWKR